MTEVMQMQILAVASVVALLMWAGPILPSAAGAAQQSAAFSGKASDLLTPGTCRVEVDPQVEWIHEEDRSRVRFFVSVFDHETNMRLAVQVKLTAVKPDGTTSTTTFSTLADRPAVGTISTTQPGKIRARFKAACSESYEANFEIRACPGAALRCPGTPPVILAEAAPPPAPAGPPLADRVIPDIPEPPLPDRVSPEPPAAAPESRPAEPPPAPEPASAAPVTLTGAPTLEPKLNILHAFMLTVLAFASGFGGGLLFCARKPKVKPTSDTGEGGSGGSPAASTATPTATTGPGQTYYTEYRSPKWDEADSLEKSAEALEQLAEEEDAWYYQFARQMNRIFGGTSHRFPARCRGMAMDLRNKAKLLRIEAASDDAYVNAPSW